jgi:hypothetical protein
MLSIGDIVEDGDASGSAEHTEHTVDLTGKNSTLRELLPSKPSLINLYWARQLDVR